jgi:uncharacterized protein (DUF433 family)
MMIAPSSWGLPTIRDTRITVGMVLGPLAAGRTIDEVLRDYPYLERDDVLAALEYAAAVNEREAHFRRVAELQPEEHLGLLVANLPTVAPDLERGARVVEPLAVGCPCATRRRSPRRTPPAHR